MRQLNPHLKPGFKNTYNKHLHEFTVSHSKHMFKLSVRQEEKGELKPRTSAGCKMSFEPFGKSPTNRRKTREHSAKRSSFVSAVWEMSGFISVISHLQHFYRPSASPNCFSLSGVSRRNQCIMFSKPESYTACSHPRQLFLSIRFSQLK